MTLPLIGISVDRKVLRQTLRGRLSKERTDLYREIAVSELHQPVVLFAPGGVLLGRRRVRGYVSTANGWRRRVVRLPRVIHKRALFRQASVLALLERMQRRGTLFINPPNMQDKETMHRILDAYPALRPHLPFTLPYRWTSLQQMLDAGESVVLKPRIGSVGRGVFRIDLVSVRGVRHFRVLGRTKRLLSRGELRRYLARRVRPERYILQKCIPLATYGGNLFDLRVPVQRGADGGWELPGMAAKLAIGHPFLTNLAQGGRALPGIVALQGAFPLNDVPAIVERIQRLSLGVAEAVASYYTNAADLGLDVGVDRSGHPWLFEVNTRDQRITFLEAGMHDAFRTLYRNPLAYCALVATSDKPVPSLE